MYTHQQQVRAVTRQLRANAAFRSVLVGLSVAALLWLIGMPMGGVAGLGTLSALAAFWQVGGFDNQNLVAITLLHRNSPSAEHSLPLFFRQNLNLAEQLQLERLTQQAATPIPFWKVVFADLRPYVLLWLLATGGAGLGYFWSNKPVGQEVVVEKSMRSAVNSSRPVLVLPPRFRSASVGVMPPPYTRLPARTSPDLNVSAYVGSVITWQVRLSQSARARVRLVNDRGTELAFASGQNEGDFRYQDRLLNSGLYALRVYWTPPGKRSGRSTTPADSLVYQSDFYRLEARPDLPPAIRPTAKNLYTTYRNTAPATLPVTATLSDDFGIQQAYLVATLARGSGENVKFRESRFPLLSGTAQKGGFRSALVAHTLNLTQFGFAPGDELYYYWLAIDNRPDPQITKSDTYFVVFKDTARTAEAELATMAVNIMPEYFRSQRQIIIDTDKLIARRKKISINAFNSESNEIGFDQKVLRLRYGQYMGEEFENQIGGHSPLADNDAHLLDGYAHKHDTETEKGGDVVKPFAFKMAEAAEKKGADLPGAAHADDHDHGPKTGQEQDPLAALMEQYVHNHDNGEVNTFYEQSTRSLLKMALEQMWQSELHLRLYEPEKARPFELKALEYLKTAQQKARAYAKKSGYDPPPLREKETRLTGELGDAPEQHRQVRTYANVPVATLVAQVLGLLELPTLTAAHRQQIRQLSLALSGPLLPSGLPNWAVLTGLQKLANGQRLTGREVGQLQTKLAAFAEATGVGNSPAQVAQKRLETAFWRNLRP